MPLTVARVLPNHCWCSPGRAAPLRLVDETCRTHSQGRRWHRLYMHHFHLDSRTGIHRIGSCSRMLSSSRNFKILLRCLGAALWNFQRNCTGSLYSHDIQIFILRYFPLDLGHRVLHQVDLFQDVTGTDFQ